MPKKDRITLAIKISAHIFLWDLKIGKNLVKPFDEALFSEKSGWGKSIKKAPVQFFWKTSVFIFLYPSEGSAK